MLETLFENVTEYVNKARQAKSYYDNQVKNLNKIYKEEPSVLEKEKAEERTKYLSKLEELYALVENIPSEIGKIKKDLQNTQAKEIPEATYILIASTLIQSPDSLKDIDKQFLLNATQHSYFARVLISQKFGLGSDTIRDFEELIEYLDFICNAVNQNIVVQYEKEDVPQDVEAVRELLNSEKIKPFVEKLNKVYNQFV